MDSWPFAGTAVTWPKNEYRMPPAGGGGCLTLTWAAAVDSTWARVEPCLARMRTTMVAPILSWAREITVGTFPCQSRKMVPAPTVKVSLLGWPIRSRVALRLPPWTLRVTLLLPVAVRVPRNRYRGLLGRFSW